MERFLNKMTDFQFLIDCEEFNTFARGFGDVEKALKSLPAMTTDGIMNRLQATFQIDDVSCFFYPQNGNMDQTRTCNETLEEFKKAMKGSILEMGK